MDITTPSALTPELASKFVTLALAHVTRQYPNKLDHVLNGPADLREPRDLHPVFYGSFEGRRWHAALSPLADAFASRFLEFLPKATYPVRVGTHSSTAFALALALEYADVTRDERLAGALRDKGCAWYGSDADCQAW